MPFDVLTRETEILAHRFLEASAGTGKTFTIEHLVTRLILEKEIEIHEILVMTFTRAATRELKTRIRSCLENTLSALLERSSLVDYVKAILEQETEKEAIYNLKKALRAFDSAQIFTLHGFCFQKQKEFAFEAGLTFSLQDPQEQNKNRGRLKNFLLTEVKLPAYSPSQIGNVLKRCQYAVEELYDELDLLLQRRAIFPALPTFRESLELFQQEMKNFSSLDIDKVVKDFHQVGPHYKGVKLEAGERQLRALFEGCDFDQLLREKDWVVKQLHPEHLKKRAKLPQDLFYPGLFERLSSSLVPIIQSAQDPILILMRLARDYREKHPEQEYSFDELMHTMHEKLNHDAFCAEIRSQYRACIIDEFQDTDPLQWKIFEKLFFSSSPPLAAAYFVGDPKQSIYRFRGADVYTYVHAKNVIREKEDLNTNFRSTPALVKALNRLFSLQNLKLPSLALTLPYLPVQAGLPERETKKKSMHFFVAVGEKTRERSFPTKKIEKEHFFPFIAQEILEQVRHKHAQFRDFALLVKDRFQGRRLAETLKKYGIPFSLAREGPLAESRAFSALKEWIEALEDPAKGWMVYAGPFFDLSFEEVKKIGRAEIHKRFSYFSSLLAKKGFFFCLAEFLHQAKPQNAEFAHVLELLAQKGDAYTSQELLVRLEHLKISKMERRPAAKEDSVAILTVHMSKGLEFEQVFVLTACARHAQGQDFIFSGEKIEKFDKNAPLSRLFLEEEDAEKMRQFYVALTRAKQRVYIPVALENEPKELGVGEASSLEIFFKEAASSLHKDSVLQLLEKLSSEVSLSYEVLKEPIFIEPFTPELTDSVELPVSRRIPERSRLLLSFSALAHKQERTLPQAVVGEKTPHTLPRGPEVGNILHKIFELIFKKHLHGASCAQARRALAIDQIAHTELHGWEETICSTIESILVLPLFGFTLANLPAHKIFSEMEFLFPQEGNIIKGFADLVFEWEKKYYIVDWKSNWLGPDSTFYDPAHLEDAMQAQDYFLQAKIYATALERYVKLFDTRPFAECFGGAFYIFLRGNGVYHVRGNH